jgi:hypothetical protein
MSWFAIVLEPNVRFVWLESIPDVLTSLKGKTYTQVKDAATVPLFYDWIRDDSDDRFVGIELHILPDHSSLVGLTRVTVDYVETTPFLRIWFQSARNGHCDGLEAFGDLCFFVTDEHEWLVLVGTNQWISSDDVEQLYALTRQT